MRPGPYRYYSWPQSIWNRRLTAYFRRPDPPTPAQGEAWPIALNESYHRVWDETPNRTPHQFVVETLLLCGLGGLAGVGLAAGAISLVAQLSKWPALISWGVVRLSVILSLSTGLIFGLYPASRAARMDPVEALRYE